MIMPKKLHVETIGAGPPLVLLHGWGWHSGIWDPLLPVLSKKFQVYSLDLPGFGKSPLVTENYAIDAILPLILDAVPPKANWLGWSLGGLIAWHIAIHMPERVTQLITVASSPKFVQSPQWPGMRESTLQQFAHSLTTNYQQTLHDFLTLQLRGSAKNQVLFTQLQQQLARSKPTELPALLGGLALLEQIDLRNKLHQTPSKSLHIFGSHDVLVPAQVADLIQPQLPQGKCIIINRAGHIPFLSQTDVFLEALFSELNLSS